MKRYNLLTLIVIIICISSCAIQKTGIIKSETFSPFQHEIKKIYIIITNNEPRIEHSHKQLLDSITKQFEAHSVQSKITIITGYETNRNTLTNDINQYSPDAILAFEKTHRYNSYRKYYLKLSNPKNGNLMWHADIDFFLHYSRTSGESFDTLAKELVRQIMLDAIAIKKLITHDSGILPQHKLSWLGHQTSLPIRYTITQN